MTCFISDHKESLELEADPACPDKWYDLFQDSAMLVRLAVLGINWFFVGMIFYGLNLSRRAPIPSTFHVAMFFNGMLDLLSEILVAVACYKTKLTR